MSSDTDDRFGGIMQSTLWCARNLGQSIFWKNLPTQRLVSGEEHSCQRRCQEKVITRRDAEFHIAIKCVEAPSPSQTPSRCPDGTHVRFWMTSSSTSICPMYQFVLSASKTLSKVCHSFGSGRRRNVERTEPGPWTSSHSILRWMEL